MAVEQQGLRGRRIMSWPCHKLASRAKGRDSLLYNNVWSYDIDGMYYKLQATENPWKWESHYRDRFEQDRLHRETIQVN